MGAHFLLQVKKNNPVLYKEISDFFDLLNTEKEKDAKKFDKKYADIYDKYSTYERNRDRDDFLCSEISGDIDSSAEAIASHAFTAGKDIIFCHIIGCGVVPVDKKQRYLA